MKRIAALLLSFAMLCLLIAGCGGDTISDDPGTQPATEPSALPSVSVKYHEPAADFAGGSGTEADPYQISNAAELALLGQKLIDEAESFDTLYTNASYILTADIALNDTDDFDNWAESAPEYGWEPIGRTSEAFAGTFDGNGHTVSGMYIYADADTEEDYNDRTYGLFAHSTGTIRNLKLEHSYICVSGNGTAAGTVVGQLKGDAAAVENCSVHSVIDVYGSVNAGGIAGQDGIVKGCEFSGTLTQMDDGFGHLGGMTGYLGQISDCTNLGSISGNGYSGGISGWGSQIENCVNKGTVGGDTAGGIAGNMYKAALGIELSVSEYAIRSCVNEGQVSGVSVAGGIVGKAGNDEVDIAMYVSDCENRGQVTCDEACAGIIGELLVERVSVLTVENCTNHSDLTGKGKVGGIICELTGGLANQQGDVTVSGCENLGNITCEGEYSGGVVTYFMLMGEQTDLRLNIVDCINSGNITSKNHAGGILCFSTSLLTKSLEISDNSAIGVKNCSNGGKILGLSSNSYVGGIAGNFSAEGVKALFENCTNSGEVRLELSLTEEEILETQKSDVGLTLAQMVGGIVGRLGEGALSFTDLDDGSADNIQAEDAWIVLRSCQSTGALSATDYSEYTVDGRQIWVNYIGGIIGHTCAEDAYSCLVENCTYTGADRGLGNTEYPDVGTKK